MHKLYKRKQHFSPMQNMATPEPALDIISTDPSTIVGNFKSHLVIIINAKYLDHIKNKPIDFVIRMHVNNY